MISLETILLLFPEIGLIVLAVTVIVCSAFQPSRWWAGVCAVCMGIVLLVLWRQDVAIWRDSPLAGAGTGHLLSGPLFVDAFGHLGRWLAVVLGLLFLPLAAFAAKEKITGEFLGASVLAFVGLMIVASAADLVLLLMGLELISIPTYFLLFVGRSDSRGAEATVKYFFLSVLSSALFLYGLSFVYGAAGTTHLADIHLALANSPDRTGAKFMPMAMVLLLVGLGFKIAAVPFHFYAPDVYQATSNANAGLLAVLPKAAGVLAIARIGHAIAPVDSQMLVQILIVMSIASMTLGNASALWQNDLRRMLAYSSIAHAGYMLIGLAAAFASPEAGGANGVGATVFYLMAYCMASLGAFATLAYLSNDSEECSKISQLSGLPHRHPFAAAFLAIFMFSLSGIPPLAGFWGKLTLFTSAMPLAGSGSMSIWFSVLLIAAALNAAVAAGYYLRVIAKMYFGGADDLSPDITYGVSLTPGLTVIACALLVVVSGFVSGPLLRHAMRAGESLQAVQAVTVATDPLLGVVQVRQSLNSDE